MAIDPEDNKDQLSEEEQLRQSISDLIDEYSEVLRETGESDEARNATIEAFKKTLEALSGDTERLKGIQNALNGRIEATVMSSRNYGGEIESIVTRLNEVVESITNQSDLSNRILGSFKKIRSVGNAIADDADLSYVRSTKYMENQQDILKVQEKRLEAQALEGAQALSALDVNNDIARNGNQLIDLRQQKVNIEQEALDLRMEGKIAEAEAVESIAKQYEEQIRLKQVEQQKMSIVDASLNKARNKEKLTEKEIESLKEYTRVNDNLSEQDRQRILAAIEFNNEIVDGSTHFQNLQKSINDSIAREKELNRRLGLTGAIMDSFSKIPGFSAIFKAEDVEHVKNLAREAYVEQQRFAKQAKADKEAILEVENQIKDLEKDPVENADQIEVLKVTKERLIKSKETNEKAATNVQLTTRSQIMTELVSKSLGNLKDALTDPATIFTFLVTKGLQFNSEVTDISKNLGVTETQATKIRNEFTSISANTMDTAINSERLLTAQSELNKELSLGVQFSGDTLVNFVRLTEKIGLSAQQAAKLTLASASTGESATEFAGKSALAAAQQAKTLGITVNMKEIMADTADLTNEQLILFGRQPEAIGKTLAEVKKLGIELGDLNAISSKLLDFQGSIESELEAELLTGKQLNLERARAAALAGDQATLAKEIASQVGTIGEFEKMNVLQRQKMAEALGMNVNQLSGVLIRQEAINKGISNAKDLTDEQLAAAQKLVDTDQASSLADAVTKIQEQRSAQDKFNDAVQKLQRLFGELLGGPVGELLDALVDVASVVIGPIASALNLILTPVKMLTTLLTKVPNILKVIAAGLIALNFSGISASVGGLVSKIGGLGKSIGGLIPKAGDLGGKLVSGLSSGGSGVKGFFKGLKDSFMGVQNQASGIQFDPRMAGGGRFRDMASGRMVSEEAANAAGVFKPGATPATAAADAAGQAGDSIADISPVTDDGSMLKEKMKNIAEGLKAFASMEVVKGAIGLTIASPGLFVLSKAADGLNKLGEVKGDALQEAMAGIAKGVEEFGTVKVILGSIGLLIASPGLVLLSMSVGGLKNLSEIGAEATQEAMGGLAEGIGEFGTTKVILGAIGLTIASPGLILLGASSLGLKALDSIKPKKMKEAMKSIAGGVGEFATTEVALGAIGVLLASPGLLLLGASSLGLKALDSIKPKKIKEAMGGIAKGIGKFANTEVALGAIGLTIASPGLILLGVSSLGLKAIEKLNGKAIQSSMKGITNGIAGFSKASGGIVPLLGAAAGLVLFTTGLPVLAGIALLGVPASAGLSALGTGLNAFAQAMSINTPFGPVGLVAPVALALLGTSLIPFAFALNLAAPAIEAFGTAVATVFGAIADAVVTIMPALTQGLIDLATQIPINNLLALAVALPSLAFGLGILGGALLLSAPGLLIGSFTLPLLSSSITQLGNALNGIDTTAFFQFGIGMAALTAAFTLAGLAYPLIIGGSLALSLALIPLSAVLIATAPSIKQFGEALIALNNVDYSNLLGLAGALPALALGLTFFGASLGPIAIASVGLLILSKALSPIAEIAPKLNLTSTALKGIATSVALLATSLNTLDAAKLETLSDFESNINVSSVSTPTTDQSTTATNTVDQASVATNTATNTVDTLDQTTSTNVNTVDQASVATNTATNTVDQVNTITSTTSKPVSSLANEPVSSLANFVNKQNTPNNTEITPSISFSPTPPPTTTQNTLNTNTENLATTTSNATTSLEEFTAKVRASNLTERTQQQFIDAKTRSLGIKPEVEVIDLDAKKVTKEQVTSATNVNTVDQTTATTVANSTNEIVPGISVTTPPSTTTQEALTTNTENLATTTSNATTSLEEFTTKINASNLTERTKQQFIDAKANALGVKPYTEAEVINLDTKNTTTSTVDQSSVASNTTTSIVDQPSVLPPPPTVTQENLVTSTKNLSTSTSEAAVELERFVEKINNTNASEFAKRTAIDMKSRALGIKPEVEVIDLDTKEVNEKQVTNELTPEIPASIPVTTTQETLTTSTENLSTSTSNAVTELEIFTEKINNTNASEFAKQNAIRAKANALGVKPYTEAEVIDLDAKKVTNEIVPGISVATPPVTPTQLSPPVTTTQETLTTSTENLSTSTSEAVIELERFVENINNTNASEFAKQNAIRAKANALGVKPYTEAEVIDLDAKKVTNEIVPGISVATPNPETPTPTSLERILTLNTNEINTAIGLLNSSKNDRSSNLDTLDILKAQAALVDLRDGQQDIPTEKFSTQSLEIVESIIRTVSKLGANTEFQQVGEKITGAEISNVQGAGFNEEKVRLFKAQEPKTDSSIETPTTTSTEDKKADSSQVFIDNIQPLIAETVATTINTMLPPMVSALKEGQGKVKVVNDSFNSSGQKGDINTIRRLPSDNFA